MVKDDSEISWIQCGYNGSGKIVFNGEGSGGMPEFISKLPADEVIWGAFKVVGVGMLSNFDYSFHSK